MSIKQDAEVAANVDVGGTTRSALFYDSVTLVWRTKNQAGTLADLVNGVSSFNGRTGTVSPASGDYSAFYQPLDSDLTAIAALTTTSFGRSFLDRADAAATRTLLVLGTAAQNNTGDFQASNATLSAVAGTTFAANSLLIGSGAGTVAQVTFAANTIPGRSSTGNLVAKTVTDFGFSLLASADAAAARTALGLGTAAQNNTGDFQPADATLTSLAAADWVLNALPIGSGTNTVAQVTFAANTFPGRSSSGNLVAKTITDFGFSLLTSADATAARTTLSAETAGAAATVQSNLNTHTGASTGAHAGTAISNTPAGNIAATTVQAAINELDAEKQPLNANLTAIAAAVTTSYGIGQLAYATSSAATAALNVATATLNGLQAAADKAYADAQAHGVFNVRTYGATGDGTTDDTSFINNAIAAAVAFNAGTGGAAGQRGAVVYFPPGIYKLTAALTSPNANGIIFVGAGSAASTLLVTFATGDVLSFVSGKAFAQLRSLQFFSSVTRTSGAFVNTNGCNDVTLQDFVMSGAFEGVAVTGSSIKVIVQDYEINGCTSATGVGIRIQNGLAGDTYITGKGVMSNSPGAKPLCGVRVKQSGHFFIGGLNCTSTDQGLLIDPDASMDVSYGFLTDNLFDSGGTNGLKINPANSATARVRSLKFVDNWFAGNAAGAGILLTSQGASAIVDDLEFIGSRILNNGTHGVQHAFGTNVRFLGGTVAGNSIASSGASDGINVAAGVTQFMITGVRSGPVGTASNTQRYGCAIAAGASNFYQILDNDFRGNLTGGLSDAGTGTSKNVSGNLPNLQAGAIKVNVANVTFTAVTSEQAVISQTLDANVLQAGTTIRVKGYGYATQTAAAITLTAKLRIGTTTLTGNVAALAAATSGTTARTANTFTFDALVTIRTAGGSGTAIGGAFVGGNFFATGALATEAAVTTPVAVDTTSTKLVEFTLLPSAATLTGVNIVVAEMCIDQP